MKSKTKLLLVTQIRVAAGYHEPLGAEMNTKHKKEFIYRELFSATLGATVQRSRIYAEDVPEKVRNKFKKLLREELESLLPQYESEVSEEQHTSNIETLAKNISNQCSTSLSNGRFRIGSAQKALNLYLKYMWCIGQIECPPHCPIDAIVLRNIPDCSGIKWTILDSISEYKEIIKKAKQVASTKPLPQWELELWNGT